MSRARERRETVSVTGSSDATIRVSVRNVERPTPASTPMMRTLVRAPAGDGEAAGVALGPALDSGPADAPGSAVGAAGFHAPLPVVDGANTTFTSSRATFVAYPRYAWGPIAISATSATGMASRPRSRGRRGFSRLDPIAARRQSRMTAWKPIRASRTLSSRARLPSRTGPAETATPARRPTTRIDGSPKRAARASRPAARWPSPGTTASSSAGR
jgi:hypothetical protein